MLKNYFITAWRNLNKNKAFSFINILGLTIGITVCMMIYLFIINEFSFDNFHKDKDRIYRVMRGFKNEGQLKNVAYVSGMYGPALTNEYSGLIDEMVRVSQDNSLVTIGDQSFHEKEIIATDPNFFTFFSFPLISGDKKTVLKNPNSVVLTETTAKKYFGTTSNIIGKPFCSIRIFHLQ